MQHMAARRALSRSTPRSAGTLLLRACLITLLACFYIDGYLRDSTVPELLLYSVIAVPTAVGLLATTYGLDPVATPRAADVLTTMVGATLVAMLIRGPGLTPALAVAFVGTAAGLIGLSHVHGATRIPAPALCGAMVGMTSSLVFSRLWWVVAAAAAAGVFFSLLRSTWEGVGGKVGLLGFAGVFVISRIAEITGHLGAGPAPFGPGTSSKVIFVVVPVVAAMLTYQVRRQWGVSATLACSAVALLSALTIEAVRLDARIETSVLSLVALGGAIVGMTAPTFVDGRPWLLIAAAMLFALLQGGFEPTLAGMGGDFGATAVIAVLAVIGAEVILVHLRPASHV